MFGFGKKGRKPVTEIVDQLRSMVSELQASKAEIAEEATKVEETRNAELKAHEDAMKTLDGQKEALDVEAKQADDVITGLSNVLGSATPVQETPAS